MKLKEYKAKRKFKETPEPGPGHRHKGKGLVFVVHKHAARALHYDLRLEMEGVLKSWAVPKGPSLDPTVKRLAVMVEDHPFDYRDFEGVIPEGNYGAGGVIIWDRGLYRHPSARAGDESERLLLEGLKKGDLKFVLEGEKLHGEFALVKTGMGRNSWLLLKKKDVYAVREDILVKNRSVASGRTLEELFDTGNLSASARRKKDRLSVREAIESRDVKDAPERPMPHDLQPMLAIAARAAFDHPDWVFEVKWDGYRAIAEVGKGEVSLYSRNRKSLKKKFPAVAEALGKLQFEAIVDGEIVVVDERGRSDFQMLQNYRKAGKGRLVYYVFDLLYYEGHDLTGLPLLRRKDILKKILPPLPELKFSDHVGKDGVLFFEAARQNGLEGIVAKHSGSAYLPGRRSGKWLKVKTRLTQEGVIAGFTEPRGGRRFFGSLVLGAYKGKELVYIGHSGGGFTSKTLKEIHERLAPLARKKCPFKTIPDTDTAVTWVKPELVCEVALQGWTDEGLMRQPVFLRLREDKSPLEVTREKPGR